MSIATARRLSHDEYLAFERSALEKHEFIDGKVIAVPPVSIAHVQIVGHIVGELHNRLKGGNCEPLCSNMRVHIPAKRKFTYPDVLVVCGKPELLPGVPDNLLNPRVIVEVLSPFTAAYDRSAKFRHYQAIESLAEYVLVEQDSANIDCFTRGENGEWTLRASAGLDAVLQLRSIQCELPHAEIYRGVEFPPDPTELSDELRAPEDLENNPPSRHPGF